MPSAIKDVQARSLATGDARRTPAKRPTKPTTPPPPRGNQYDENVRAGRVRLAEEIAHEALEAGDFATAGRTLELICRLEGHERAVLDLVESWKGRRARDRDRRSNPTGALILPLGDHGDPYGDDAEPEGA